MKPKPCTYCFEPSVNDFVYGLDCKQLPDNQVDIGMKEVDTPVCVKHSLLSSSAAFDEGEAADAALVQLYRDLEDKLAKAIRRAGGTPS